LGRGAGEMDDGALGLGTGDFGGRRYRRHDDMCGDLEGARGKGERLCMISYAEQASVRRRARSSALRGRHTRAMRNNPPSPNLLEPLLLDQSRHGMECAPHFERANALEVFALEKHPYFRLRGLLALPLSAL
jgi:hypothetical protein